VEPAELLQKYNPILVLLPQDTSRHRPWSRWYQKVDEPRGDYHPCEPEFFLSYVFQRPRPRRWSLVHFLRPQPLPQPTGLPALRFLLEGTSPEEVRRWELDVAPIRSQRPAQAWRAYASMLQERPWPEQAYAFGRYVPGPPAVLQYWYLYVYNDAPNRHEGDWEMVAIELDDAGAPRRAGYAGHGSGFKREWARVEQKDGRPLVYVARGSHAAYFEHRPEGHRTNSLPPRKGWPEPLESAWSRFSTRLQDLFFFLRLLDRTPDNPERPKGEARDRGVLVTPCLIAFPGEGSAAPSFWWMDLHARWGSRHSRIEGTIGPSPPWRQPAQWDRPSNWIDGLVED
jgi:hypothetical protein